MRYEVGLRHAHSVAGVSAAPIILLVLYDFAKPPA